MAAHNFSIFGNEIFKVTGYHTKYAVWADIRKFNDQFLFIFFWKIVASDVEQKDLSV